MNIAKRTKGGDYDSATVSRVHSIHPAASQPLSELITEGTPVTSPECTTLIAPVSVSIRSAPSVSSPRVTPSMLSCANVTRTLLPSVYEDRFDHSAVMIAGPFRD